MLVITRRRGERFRIGTDIEVLVTSVADGKVRLGITAPRDVNIVRDDARKKQAVRK
jgi:carbon storage regulator